MLLRFLLIAIIILYAIRAIVRFVIPLLFQSVINKAQQSQQHQQNYNRSNNNPTGRIKIDYIPEESTKSKVPDTEGDFVDYEEIKK